MDRETRKWLRSNTKDPTQELQKATRLRMAQQVSNMAEPAHPATGTDRVSALLAEARRLENEALAAARRAAAPRIIGGR
jgi:hypothetical protein